MIPYSYGVGQGKGTADDMVQLCPPDSLTVVCMPLIHGSDTLMESGMQLYNNRIRPCRQMDRTVQGEPDYVFWRYVRKAQFDRSNKGTTASGHLTG